MAYVAHADDIRTVLARARARAVPVAIRNGGHSYAGWSSGDGRLIVDVSALDTVRASAGTAVVGAKLIDVHRALAAKGATVPGGS
ncbi:lipoprotein [Streptomyces viridosporus ATCC 14672]|uniref:Lipoprotein n=1 Tax=Streptomyces viridosporus (strain ATCC 14672 / DSM 40746 / JCM 4963 / KCTC 9882 / NRRL B-12104 / FH 1290) TaxID=566461 RepID=D5ZS91_STRV1|nr:lipoprotein [Streptomyces viridosporus ATCC 14672]